MFKLVLEKAEEPTDVEAETPILRPVDGKNWLTIKDPDAGNDWRWEEKRMTEDEMVGWHHRLNGHEFEWTPGVGNGTGRSCMLQFMGLQRVGHDWATELNWTDNSASGGMGLTATFFFSFLFWPSCEACLVPWPGIEPMPPELGVWSLKHWTTREFQIFKILYLFFCHNWWLVGS